MARAKTRHAGIADSGTLGNLADTRLGNKVDVGEDQFGDFFFLHREELQSQW